MDHIIQEIDDELKRERLHNVWRSFGSHIVVLTVLVLVGTAGMVGWKEYVATRNQNATDTLVSAKELIATKKNDEAITLLEGQIEQMQGSVRVIALLWLGQLYDNKGQREKADGFYAQVRDQKDEQTLAAYADLLHSKTSDGFKNSAMFSALSKEKQGVALLRAGDKLGAAKLFSALENDVTTPNTMRKRINLVLLTLEPEMREITKNAPPASPPAGQPLVGAPTVAKP